MVYFLVKARNWGKDYKTKKEALKRLRQIEFYKNNGKKKKR